MKSRLMSFSTNEHYLYIELIHPSLYTSMYMSLCHQIGSVSSSNFQWVVHFVKKRSNWEEEPSHT